MIKHKKLTLHLFSVVMILMLMFTDPLLNLYYVSAEHCCNIIGFGHYDNDDDEN